MSWLVLVAGIWVNPASVSYLKQDGHACKVVFTARRQAVYLDNTLCSEVAHALNNDGEG